jgi:hypothetical protein
MRAAGRRFQNKEMIENEKTLGVKFVSKERDRWKTGDFC